MIQQERINIKLAVRYLQRYLVLFTRKQPVFKKNLHTRAHTYLHIYIIKIPV